MSQFLDRLLEVLPCAFAVIGLLAGDPSQAITWALLAFWTVHAHHLERRLDVNRRLAEDTYRRGYVDGLAER